MLMHNDTAKQKLHFLLAPKCHGYKFFEHPALRLATIKAKAQTRRKAKTRSKAKTRGEGGRPKTGERRGDENINAWQQRTGLT